ncbi:MAG: DNA polymerase III subunit beta [Verrucomicrobiales bacterium]|nr:DNA polymerase III subunit beta [Verrucomicrobiales bacterium]
MKSTPSLAVSAGDLRPALTALGKVRKRGKAVPEELQHLQVETVGRSSLRLTATDGETFLSLTLPTISPEKREPFLVRFDRLQSSLRGARVDEAIALRPVKTPPASLYPQCPIVRSKPIELGPAAVEAFHHAFGSTSQDPSRYVLQGVHLDPKGKGGTRFIGTDGRHLFQSHLFPVKGLKESIILPAVAALASPALKKADTWKLRLSQGRKCASPIFQIQGANWCLTGKLIEGNYPTYQQVIPPDSGFKARVTIPVDLGNELIRVLPGLPGRKLSNHPVALRLAESSVSVLARPTDSAPCEELILSSAQKTGENHTVFVNRDYLSHALRCGMTKIEIIDENTPMKCTGDSGILIIMPVRSLGEVKVGHSRSFGPGRTEKISEIKRESLRSKLRPRREKLRAKPESPRFKKRTPTPILMKKPSPDQKTAENPDEKIAEIKSALKVAASGLAELTACLRASRQHQRQTEKEVRSVKKTLRSLRQVEL